MARLTTPEGVARRAAAHVGRQLRTLLATQGRATVVFATGNSQRRFLRLLARQSVDWSRVTGLHLDEFWPLAVDHPGSFRAYLHAQVVRRLPGLTMHYLVDAPQGAPQVPPMDAIRRYTSLLRQQPLDLVLLGLGTNGHLALNEPGAPLDTDAAVQLVPLTEATRRQQVDGLAFHALDEVPTHALTVTLPTILGARHLVALAQGHHKREAVHRTLTEPPGPQLPASLLRTHANATLLLDAAAASLWAP